MQLYQPIFYLLRDGCMLRLCVARSSSSHGPCHVAASGASELKGTLLYLDSIGIYVCVCKNIGIYVLCTHTYICEIHKNTYVCLYTHSTHSCIYVIHGAWSYQYTLRA